MWSGRFREPLDADFEAWQRSFPFDYVLVEAEISASIAHTRAIEAVGVLTPEEAERMVKGLHAVSRSAKALMANREDLSAPFAASAHAAEDVHHFVELELTRHIGELALKLHTGRSRNEQIATDMRIYVSDAIHLISDGIRPWCRALLDLANDAGEAVMPSYTHLQRAEPVLVAHWLLCYVSMLERDLERLASCRQRLLCPLGSGAVAGATLSLDRSIPARILEFAGPTLNSMDATSDRDFALEFTQALSLFGLHCSRFAEELTLFSTAEFGFLDLPEAFSTGSSAMPQKKNPDFTELLRAKSARLVGAATQLTVLVKGLPLAYNKDLQEGQPPVFDAAVTALDLLTILPKFTSVLHFNYDRMRRAATTGYLNAMAAATYLSNKGVPFRKAHEHIGNAVRLGLESGRELEQLTLAELQQIAPEFADDFYAAITLEATLDCHDVLGGTNRARVREALASARARLSSN